MSYDLLTEYQGDERQAVLQAAREELHRQLGAEPAYVIEETRRRVVEGLIDGGEYFSKVTHCGCFYGTIAIARGDDPLEAIRKKSVGYSFVRATEESADPYSLAMYYYAKEVIRPHIGFGVTAMEWVAARIEFGDKPETNEYSQMILEWIDEILPTTPLVIPERAYAQVR